MTTVLSLLIVASSIVLIGSVLLSEPAEGGMNALTGGSSDSFWGSNRGNSREAMLNKATIAAAVVFMVSLLLIAKF